MVSVVSICNAALSNIGKENINALGEASAEARACTQFYEQTRDFLLQSYPWRFATRTLSLAEITNDKPGQWGYAYQRPVDCLKINWLRSAYSADEPALSRPDELAFAYDVEGQAVYCDLSPALLVYTTRITDPTRFSPLFVEALAWQLTVRLAMPLTRDPRARADAMQVAGIVTGQAQMADANEVREAYDYDTSFVAGRL